MPQANDRSIVVVVSIEPPFVNYADMSESTKRRRGYPPGILLEIIRELAMRLNKDVTLVPLPNAMQNRVNQRNNSWEGPIGFLERKEADLWAVAARVDHTYSSVVDYSFPFTLGEAAIAVRTRKQSDNLRFLIIVSPFDAEVWATLFATIILSALVLRCLSHWIVDRCGIAEIRYDTTTSSWAFFSMIVGQGLPIQPTSSSVRTLFGCWWLASVTLVAIFTGKLVAIFAVERAAPPFSTTSEFIKHLSDGSFTLYAERSTVPRFNLWKHSPNEQYKDLWKRIHDLPPERIVIGERAGLDIIKQDRQRAFIGNKEMLTFMASIECDITVVDSITLPPVWLTIPLTKNSSYLKPLNEQIIKLRESGFVQKWTEDYKSFVAQETKSKCAVSDAEQNKKDAFLGIKKAQGAFWMLIIGLLLAVLGTAGELCARNRYATSKKHKMAHEYKNDMHKDSHDHTYDMRFTIQSPPVHNARGINANILSDITHSNNFSRL